MSKYLKRIMTDLAAGHISKEEADMLVKGLKTHQEGPVKQKKGKPKKDQTHKRKKSIKLREVKK